MIASTLRSARTARGFTLIEVLVSLVILSVGLLGLGLLQATSLKASYGANQRTVATNLAYQMIDMIRSNRRLISRYSYIAPADFSGIPTTCDQQPVAGAADIVGDDINGWECQVVRNLPGGTATVAIPDPVTGTVGSVRVTITWTDARFANANDQGNTFALASQL